jgi:hypothetical protein
MKPLKFNNRASEAGINRNKTIQESLELQDTPETTVMSTDTITEPVFERSIIFDIPASRGTSGLQIKATEDENGGILFELIVLPGAKPKADIQALFFNTTSQLNLSSFVAEGEKVSGTDFGDTNDVGYGLNVRGQPNTYDFGVGLSPRGQAGLATQETSFTLTSTDGALRLDDIGGMEFATRINGVGTKPVMTVTAPHAPDAVDDSYDIFEDGVADLSVASKAPVGVMFSLLENDTDGDNDVLTITAVRGAQHGTVEIIDGDDADDLIGDAVLYTAFGDYHGFDSFEYLISDGDRGVDFASVEVNIAAVADIPTLALEAIATGSPDQMIIRVTSAQTDLDMSEFIDRFEMSATYEDGSVVSNLSSYLSELTFDPVTQTDALTHDFLLTLPTGSSTLFDLHVTSVSKEESNGDEEIATESIRVETVARSTDFSQKFDALNRSIWGNNGEDGGDVGFGLGLNLTVPDQEASQSFYTDQTDTGFGFRTDSTASITAKNMSINAGISVSFSARGGQVDADVVYDGNVSTLYNKTVDQLQFTTSAEANIAQSSFTTTMPSLGFDLALTQLSYNIDLAASYGGYVTIDAGNTALGTFHFGFDIDLPSIGLNLAPFLGSDGLSLVRLENGLVKIGEIPFAPDQFLLSTNEFSKTVTTGLGNEIATFTVSVPNFEVQPNSRNEQANILSGGNGGEFGNITLDLDGIAAQIAGGANPVGLTLFDYSKGPFSARGTLNALDYDLVNGLNYLQNHTLDANDLLGTIIYEDDSRDTFIFGDTVVLNDASTKDVNGDGIVDYRIEMDPEAQFNTQAGFGINMRDELDIIKAEVNITAIGNKSISAIDNFDVNAVNQAYSRDIASQTFGLDFGIAESIDLIA